MKKSILTFLLCPNCEASNFRFEPYLVKNENIEEGRLLCTSCNIWFRIENGIIDLLPLHLRRNEFYNSFAKKFGIPYSSIKVKKLSDSEQIKLSQIRFFKKEMEDYEKKVVNSPYYKALDSITFLTWIKEHIPPGAFILDLGCGTGRQCIPLTRMGIHTIGIDISEEMLLKAKKKIEYLKHGPLVDLIVGDAENPPVKNNLFDGCIFYGTLHHLADKQNAIINASNKMKEGGLFYSLDPHKSPARGIFDFLSKFWKLYNEEADTHALLTESQLQQWLSSAGINIKIKISTYLPPHTFYFFNRNINVSLLKISDILFSHLPLIRKLGGVIISSGVKKTPINNKNI